MTKRILTPFRHQDDAVQPSASFEFGGAYTPSEEPTTVLRTVLRNLQDIDTALLGVVSPARPGGGLSTARQILRQAVLEIHRLIPAGGAS